MPITLFTNNIRVFVADTSPQEDAVRQKLCRVLSRAGLEVVGSAQGDDAIQNADCSVHILAENSETNKASFLQYTAAKQLRSDHFKMFVWNPSGYVNEYINNIRRDVVENTIYSSTHSPIVFVEELRGIMNMRKDAADEVQEKDIFFIYNDLDKDTAIDIYNMLTDIQSVAKLSITMSNYTDYTQYIRNQLQGCKIGVIYYNYAGDWALSFARQVWKDTGGSSSPAPWFLVANSDHANVDDLRAFDGIIAHSVREKSLIPLDIKIFFDKTVESKPKQ